MAYIIFLITRAAGRGRGMGVPGSVTESAVPVEPRRGPPRVETGRSRHL